MLESAKTIHRKRHRVILEKQLPRGATGFLFAKYTQWCMKRPVPMGITRRRRTKTTRGGLRGVLYLATLNRYPVQTGTPSYLLNVRHVFSQIQTRLFRLTHHLPPHLPFLSSLFFVGFLAWNLPRARETCYTRYIWTCASTNENKKALAFFILDWINWLIQSPAVPSVVCGTDCSKIFISVYIKSIRMNSWEIGQANQPNKSKIRLCASVYVTWKFFACFMHHVFTRFCCFYPKICDWRIGHAQSYVGLCNRRVKSMIDSGNKPSGSRQSYRYPANVS